VSLSFASASPAAATNACSSPLVLEARDGFGNPSAPAAPVTVDLSATPPAGFTFHQDATCGTPITSVLLDAASASFTFRGASPGDVRLDAAAQAPSALGSANVTVSVGP